MNASAQLIILALSLPVLTAIAILATRNNANLREFCTLAGSLSLMITVWVITKSILNGSPLEFTLLELVPGVFISFSIEPLGLIFAFIASLLWPLTSIYSIGYMRGNNEKNQTRFYFFFAISIFCAIAIAFSGNLITLFLFYEALSLATYPLVTHNGNKQAKRGGRVYLGVLIGTSLAFFLPAVLWTYQATGTSDFTAGGIVSGYLSDSSILILAFLFLFGIGKSAVMPVHRWLPAAMVAPTPVSGLLHAVAVVKAGVFSITKVIVYIIGVEKLGSIDGSVWLMYIAGFTLVTASFIALKQDNLKRRLAYSTVGQLSYVVIATMLLAPVSAIAASLHIVAHAFGKITLFFAAGSIYTASKKTQVSQLDGIGKRMPWTMTAFAVGSISMIGLPPTAGFISKWYILMSALQAHQVFAIIVIIVSTLLNAAYFIPVIYSAFFKTELENEDQNNHAEAPRPIVIAITATASLTVIMFFFPNLILSIAQLIRLN